MTRTRLLGLAGAATFFLSLTACGQAAEPADRTTDPGPEPAGQTADEPPDSPDYLQFDGAWVTLLTEPILSGITRDPGNTLPYVLAGEPLFSEDWLTWDGWPIRNNQDLSVSVIDGWVVYIALSAPRVAEGASGSGALSSWRYWITRGDGTWQYQGLVFPEGTALGDRQWAGSTRYDPDTGRVTFYYTAVGPVPGGADPQLPDEFPQGDPRANRPPVTQQIAVASADLVADDQGVRFENFSEHEPIAFADGEIYQTEGQSINDQVIYGFRDPFHFIDPDSGEEFILFTANAAYKPGPHNGVIGVAWHNQDSGEWVNLPPIVQAAGTSSQLERPHLVWQDGLIYLFFTTHNWTFEPQDIGPEGLYGFVTDSPSFRGRYVPLNGTSLIAGNPEYEPAMSYSWLVLPGGHTLSYIKNVPADDFLAVPAPLFQISLDGTEAKIVDTLTPLGPTDVAGPPDGGTGGGGGGGGTADGGSGGTTDGGMADGGSAMDGGMADGGGEMDGGMGSSSSSMRAEPAPEPSLEGELILRDAFGSMDTSR